MPASDNVAGFSGHITETARGTSDDNDLRHSGWVLSRNRCRRRFLGEKVLIEDDWADQSSSCSTERGKKQPMKQCIRGSMIIKAYTAI